MTPSDLRDAITALPVSAPLSEEAERLYWPQRGAWFRDQREHWIGWLTEHEQRGTRSAGLVYDRIQAPAMLIWLAEAAGVDRGILADVIDRAASLSHHSARCNAIRRDIPWSVIATLLRSNQT
jgi:hypothetical protein